MADALHALEDRVARLEEALFFQERLVQDLNTALTVQQRQLDAAEKNLKEAQEHIHELRMLLDAGGGDASLPPPHYL